MPEVKDVKPAITKEEEDEEGDGKGKKKKKKQEEEEKKRKQELSEEEKQVCLQRLGLPPASIKVYFLRGIFMLSVCSFRFLNTF